MEKEKKYYCFLIRRIIIFNLQLKMTRTALTFNLSWAVQLGEVKGSEANFVYACQKRGIDCFKNSLKIIEGGGEDLCLIGLQEVSTPKLEKKIMKMKSLSHMTGSYRGTLVQGGEPQFDPTNILIWDESVFGKEIFSKTIDLDYGRPCISVYTTKGYLLICAHFPHNGSKSEMNKIIKKVQEVCPKNLNKKYTTIMLGDFNDHGVNIHKDSPVKICDSIISQNMKKREIVRELKSCCWKEGKKRGFQGVGDYILATSHIMNYNYIPEELYNTRDEPHASDHLPVFADLNL
jgi:exonuclease III